MTAAGGGEEDVSAREGLPILPVRFSADSEDIVSLTAIAVGGDIVLPWKFGDKFSFSFFFLSFFLSFFFFKSLKLICTTPMYFLASASGIPASYNNF